MDKMLELLRIQRHNFANHLQVISGLLQLKKYDKAFDYIRQVGDELNRIGVVARLEKPELVKNIFLAELSAANRGIRIEHSICTSLQRFSGSDDVLAGLIKEMIDFAINFAKIDIHSDNIVKFILSENAEGYLFEVCFPSENKRLSSENENIYITSCASLRDNAKGAGWQLEVSTGENTNIVSLVVPYLA